MVLAIVAIDSRGTRVLLMSLLPNTIILSKILRSRFTLGPRSYIERIASRHLVSASRRVTLQLIGFSYKIDGVKVYLVEFQRY